MNNYNFCSMAPEVGACETAFGSSIVTAANKESENVMRNIISINNKYTKL